MTLEEIHAKFCECFEKIYDVHFTDAGRNRIFVQLKKGWSGADDSDRQLVKFVLAIYDEIQAASVEVRPYLFQLQRQTFALEFSSPTSTERGQLLNLIRTAVEALKPGVTTESSAPAMTTTQGAFPQTPTVGDEGMSPPPGFEATLHKLQELGQSQMVAAKLGELGKRFREALMNNL